MLYDLKIIVVDDTIRASHKASPAQVHCKKFSKILLIISK